MCLFLLLSLEEVLENGVDNGSCKPFTEDAKATVVSAVETAIVRRFDIPAISKGGALP